MPTSFSRILSDSDLDEVRTQYLQALAELEAEEDDDDPDTSGDADAPAGRA